MSDVKAGLRRVRFQGREYLVGDHTEVSSLVGVRVGSALATKEQRENFEPSFAHVCADGRIMQHGVQIGVVGDLEEIEE